MNLEALISSVMQRAQQAKKPQQLDPVQKNNLAAFRKMVDAATTTEELDKYSKIANRYGVDMDPYYANLGVTSPTEQQQKDVQSFIGSFLKSMTPIQPTTQTSMGSPEIGANALASQPISPPEQSSTYALNDMNLEKIREKWSVSVTSDGKVTLTNRPPKSEKEKITDDYINNLSPNELEGYAEALANKDIDKITTEKETLEDGSQVERTVGYRGRRKIFTGPDRIQQLPAETTATQEAEAAAESAAAVAEAVPPSTAERAYADYTSTAQQEGYTPMPRGDWERYNTSTGMSQIIQTYGSPRDAMGNLLTKYSQNPKFRQARIDAWNRERAIVAAHGVSELTLDIITNRIYSDLMAGVYEDVGASPVQ